MGIFQVNENTLELACFEWLEALGYECLEGMDVAPEEKGEIRKSYSEYILRNNVREAIERLNFDVTLEEQEHAFNKLNNFSAQSIVDGNKQIYDWLRNGVPVETKRDDGSVEVKRLKIFDFNGKNKYLAVRQMSIMGLKLTRPDIILFVNGLPLVVIELKRPNDLEADIEKAYNQIQSYKYDIPQFFNFNLLNVISDGVVARYGSLTADFERYSPWRLLNNEKVYDSQIELEVLIRGLLNPTTLIDFFKGFVVYQDEDGAPSRKIIAQWHQYHGIKRACERALDCLLNKKDGKGGVIWHTQGSGKSLEALMYVMNIRDMPEFKNPTVVLVTDRNDLDGQLYDDFALSSWSLRGIPKKAESRADLKTILGEVEAGGIFFTTINKFAPSENGKVDTLCDRSNVIVICDEAHRTQYGFKATLDSKSGRLKYGLAKYMRDALPNAIYLGMTGTPISYEDKDTEEVFGAYIDIYDMVAAQEDGAVVQVGYESRIVELSFNEAERQSLVEDFIKNTDQEDETQQAQIASKYTRLEEIAISDGRMGTLAKDLIEHWELRKEQMDGKAMFVAISRPAAVKLYNEIVALKPDWHHPDLDKGKVKVVMTGSSSDPIEFQPHRTTKTDREFLKKRLKNPEDELEIVIVRDMWLTGFNAPPVHTLYVDKPMQGQSLMQAVTRTNRVWKDKSSGLVVDYIGLGQELKEAIKQYTRVPEKTKNNDKQPIDVSGEALKVLLDTLDVIRKEFYHGFDYHGYKTPSKALRLLQPAMEHILQVNIQPDKQGRNSGVTQYIDLVTKLSKAQDLAGTFPEALEHRDEIAFFQAIKVSLIKLTRSGAVQGQSKQAKEAAMRQIVAKGILVEGVNDIFQTLGLEQPNLSLLDEKFLAQIKEMPTKNLAAEMLSRLLNDQIKARARKNAIQGKEFSKKLEEAILRYQNRSITTVEVIQVLMDLAKEFNQSGAPDGMTDEEFAFYQALAENESAVKELGHPVLKALALELTDKLRKSATINWQNRRASRAKMMVMVKVLLKKHRYPPDNEIEATEKILTQAELLADEWAFEV